ncbi:hypothetical protein RHMOL_Rhmol05G0025100 [Rhododendron molle]|uniref:Uncharacterized protein n=1 Tax=Rhododendron molle TaxID=49168 RepID=A0ACC0NLV7_RHOML|nr:hypothetical protein RHMOL_Rhmol05G0025100 [Rhododendron molle]
MSSSSLVHSRRPLFSALRTLSLRRDFSTSLPRILVEEKDNATPGKSPSFIHPAAIVHPGAVIGQGVSIGPFCTVGSSAKLGNACQLYPGSHIFGNTELGDQCVLMTGAVVGDDLPGRTVIGCNNVIGHHCVVGIKCQDMKYKVIGDNNLVMGSCHIAHDCKVGSNNILANNTLLAGHVVVEDYAHTAGATVVHQFCHIGSFSFIGGGSVVIFFPDFHQFPL